MTIEEFKPVARRSLRFDNDLVRNDDDCSGCDGAATLQRETGPIVYTRKEISDMKLSVVMPVYNERVTLREVVEKVLAVPLEIELICVDDGFSRRLG